MVEVIEKTPTLPNPDDGRAQALHAAAYGDPPIRGSDAARAKSVTPNEEADKVIDLAKNRLDTFDSITGNATQAGIAAAKALASEVASLTPSEAADVNTALIARYRNMYPTSTPVPTGMVNDIDHSTGMEFRASKFDFWPGPHSLQILDDGRTVTVRREVEPGGTVDGKYIPPTYSVDAQAARE